MIEVTGENATLEAVLAVAYQNDAKLKLSKSAQKQIEKSRQYIETEMKKGKVMYGVNTGFGALSSVQIPPKDIQKLQENIIRSHASGVGVPFSKEETRAIMYLRANTLSRGHSGVRTVVVEKLLEFLHADVLPVIPSQGSLGASGDLAPLSHLALALIGEGHVWSDDKNSSAGAMIHNGAGFAVPTATVLKKKKIAPLKLESKEGLSLINGCQVMTAVGMLALSRARELCLLADLAGAMSLEALRGSRDPFDEKISATRPHPGEQKTARNMRRLLGPTSGIAKSHIDCDRVQDAYSLRCIPAVHGAVKDALRSAYNTLLIEANSSTDNPLVFSEAGEVLSCGNFHGEPVAFQMDFLGIAISALANISQCRISRMVNPAFSRLPAFLTPEPGLNSGLMVVEYAAASLVSENKVYSHPASVDSIPTSVDKEDHVSMGTIGARKLKLIVENATNVIAMEMLAAMQALSLLKSESNKLVPAAGVKAAFDLLVKDVPLAKTDRVYSEDVKKIREKIDSGELLKIAQKATGDLEW